MSGTRVRMSILLARHGETVWNVEGRWQGLSDSPLTDRGRAQARQLARALADEPIAAVYASHLGRAVGTAREVAGVHGLDVIPDPRLAEIDVGAWTGRLGSEIEAEYPRLMAAWRSAPATVRLPGGETLAEAQARALACLAERLPEVSEVSEAPEHAKVAAADRRQARGQMGAQDGHLEASLEPTKNRAELDQSTLDRAQRLDVNLDRLSRHRAGLAVDARDDGGSTERSSQAGRAGQAEPTNHADGAGQTGQTIAIITHGAVGQCILIAALGGSVDDLWLRQRLDNCALSRLEWTPQHGLRVVDVCDVRHLADVGSLRGWRTTDVA